MEHSVFHCGRESKLISSWNEILVPLYWKLQSILCTELFTAQASFVISPVTYLSFQVILSPFSPLKLFFFQSLPHLCISHHWGLQAEGSHWGRYWCPSRSAGCSPEIFHSLLAWVILQLILWGCLTQGVVLKHYSMKSLVMSRILTLFSCFRW